MTTNQQNFYQLNLAYLHAARELTRIALQKAVLCFGLTRDVVDALIEMVIYVNIGEGLRCGSLYLTGSQQGIQLKCPVRKIMAEQTTGAFFEN